MPSFPHAVRAPSIVALGDGGTHMAKGQKRSNKEVRKPKATKAKGGAAAPSSKGLGPKA